MDLRGVGKGFSESLLAKRQKQARGDLKALSTVFWMVEYWLCKVHNACEEIVLVATK